MRTLSLLVLFSLASCGPPIRNDAVRGVSDDLARVGHPFGRFEAVDITGFKRGNAVKHKRYVDLEIRYVRGLRPEPNTMAVRVYQESVSPCKISVDVLSDDGPDPFLLDNKLASNAFGDAICRELEED